MTSYTSTTVWLLICVIGIGTFGLRFALIALADRGDRIPDSIQRGLAGPRRQVLGPVFVELQESMQHDPKVVGHPGLRFIPPAVLAAIAAPAFLLVDDAIDVTTDNLRLFAGLLAYLVAWRTKSVLWTIISGMVALWILQAVT